MKTKLYYIIMLFCLIVSAGCSDDYDDSKLWDSVNGLENRVAKLEELCKQMNTNISSLQEIVTALQKNESIKSVATLSDGSGYLITFSSGKTITIYHGKNGVDGEDGKDGENGKDAITPVISVKKDADGIYYWTVNNDWLLVDGKKVKAEGTDGADGVDGKPGIDGEDGTNGKDGITPQFKIEDGYWYISYDNEQSWTKLGKATGDSGLNGTDGDNFFKGVSIEDGYVCFTLNDKDSTVIKLPFVSDNELTIEVKEPGTLKSLLTDEDMRTVISLKLKGSLNEDDFATIRYWMFVVENVDLSDTNISELTKDAFREMSRLKKVILPASCTKISENAFYNCRILSDINTSVIQSIENSAFAGCENLPLNEFPNVATVGENAFMNCRNIRSLNAPKAVMAASAISQCPNLTELIIGNFVNGDFDGQYSSPELIITIKGNESGTILCNSMKNINTIILGSRIYDVYPGFGGAYKGAFQVKTLLFEEPSTFPDFAEDLFRDAEIQNITIPTSVAKIGETAFALMKTLETVIIPRNARLKEIATYHSPSSYGNGDIRGIFYDCTSLKDVYCYLSTPPNVETLFGGTGYGEITLHVPAESVELYKANKGWKTGFRNVVAIE